MFPHQRLRLLDQFLMLAVLLTDSFILFLIFLNFLTLSVFDLPSDLLCRISSPTLQLSFYSSAVVISVLILDEIAKIDKSLGKIFLLLSFERVVSFLDVS